MKTSSFLLACLLLSLGSATTLPAAEQFDSAHRFVFYAVLEGCYDDGLSSNDAEQILLRPEKGYPLHFVYSCPLCMPALQAFEAYQSRPPRFFGLKSGVSTFGPGLDAQLSSQLYSKAPEDRLTAVNALVQRWVQRRMTALRLSEPERATLQQALEEKRKKGMVALKSLKGRNDDAPGYAGKDECAVCNGAVGTGLPKSGRP